MFRKCNLLLTPRIALRIGLGFTFIYAGVYSFLDPTSWIGFIPLWIANIIDAEILISIHAVIQLVLGLALLTGFLLPLISFISFFDILAILLFYGIDAITFRDSGLLMATLGLFLLAIERKEQK